MLRVGKLGACAPKFDSDPGPPLLKPNGEPDPPGPGCCQYPPRGVYGGIPECEPDEPLLTLELIGLSTSPERLVGGVKRLPALVGVG